MYVRLLIGKAAGTVVDMPYHAATAGFAAGTCRAVTDLELRGSGTDPAGASDTAPEAVPLGYRVLANEEDGGYDLFDPEGVRVNLAPIRSLAAARSIAENHFARTQRMVADPATITVVSSPKPEVAETPRAFAAEFAAEQGAVIIETEAAKSRSDLREEPKSQATPAARALARGRTK